MTEEVAHSVCVVRGVVEELGRGGLKISWVKAGYLLVSRSSLASLPDP